MPANRAGHQAELSLRNGHLEKTTVLGFPTRRLTGRVQPLSLESGGGDIELLYIDRYRQPGELNAALRPDLSDLASSFLRDLSHGRYTELELNEDYGTTLLDDGDPKAVISGGEEDIANLALRLAISQMIAERAGQPLSLLVLDEIFGSLDEDRRVAVVDLLRSLADRFPQVILITHIDSVRDGFDRVIRVGLDVTRGVATARDEPLAGHDVAA